MTKELLEKVASGEITVDEAQKSLAEDRISFKVSEKGCLSMYGVRKQFPVSLYKNQWKTVLDASDAVREFIAKNEAVLKDQ